MYKYYLMPKEMMKCPTCKGHGEIEKPGNTIVSRQRRRKEIAKTLRSEGYSIREIMALMSYKSTNSVSKLLE